MSFGAKRASDRGMDQTDSFERRTDPSKLKRVEGIVSYVKSAIEETGWRVLKVSVEEGKPDQTWVGVMPAASPGQSVMATGVITTHPKWGDQLKVTTMTATMPATIDGMEKYLGSGILPGIGVGMARRIVQKFGTASLAMLDQEPAALAEVGIRPDKIAEIAEAWAEQRSVAEIMIFLQHHGASSSLAKKIFKKYGGAAIEIVSKAPYRLAIDVFGVGFNIADSIARSVGIGKGSPDRAQAAVLHQLRSFEKGGHVFTTRDELLNSTSSKLDVEFSSGSAAIAVLHESGHLIDEDGDVYPGPLHAAEVRLAERMRDLLDAPPATPILAFAAPAIAEFEEKKWVTLAPEQRDAIQMAAANPFLVVTGGPGVGKTTIILALLALYHRAGLTVRLAAPTGRAARRMSEATGLDAMTLHRLLEFNPSTRDFGLNGDMPINADVVIVDEASMLDVQLADSLFDAIADDTRVVLVGDVDQLKSVGPGAVLKDAIDSGEVPTVRLTRIFRQAAGSLIVDNAHRINSGTAPITATQPDGEFFVIERVDEKKAADAIVELVVNRIQRGFGLHPTRDTQVLAPAYKGDAGVNALNARLQAELNPVGVEVKRGSERFRVGDKVMQLKNDTEREISNGDVGFIVDADPEKKTLVVQFDDRTVKFESSEVDDLTLAYAITIHKSQGSEYPCVIIPVLMSSQFQLSRNLIYTACTRGKKRVVLIADPRAIRIALGETRRENRRTKLADRLRAAPPI